MTERKRVVACLLLYVWAVSVPDIAAAIGYRNAADRSQLERVVAELLELRAEVEELKSAAAKQNNRTPKSADERDDNTVSNRESTSNEQQLREATRGEMGSIGTTYVRWGRTLCENSAQVVYRGYMAGAHYAQDGGGSNFLCLHKMPQWKRLHSGFATWAGIVYGMEYEQLSDNDVFSNRNNHGHPVLDNPAPCALCYVTGRYSTIMIPARTECPDGWTKEYEGYLVSEATFKGRHRTENVCMDEAPEIALGGTSQNQGVVYSVQVACGSLPCSRFVNGRELTCVVCTK